MKNNTNQILAILFLLSLLQPQVWAQAPVKISILDAQNPHIVKTTIKVELADNWQDRYQGLSGRAGLAPDAGMLFIYEQLGLPKYWMKDMKFPLDIIWIWDDAIVDITVNVPPPPPRSPDSQLKLYVSKAKCNKVLEVKAGFVKTHHIHLGDKVIYSH